jgi:Domain of unknown function (DUF4760)
MDSANVTVRFRFLSFWTGLLITIITTILLKVFIPGMPIRDVAAVFTAGIVCTTLYYHARNLRFNYEINTEKLKSDKKIAAVNLIGDWHKAENIRNTIIARDFLLDNIRAADDDIISKLEDKVHTDARVAVVSVLNYLERIAIAAIHDAADEQILKDYFIAIFDFYAHKALPFITARRKEKQDDKLFVFFLDINRKWNQSPS